jgi:hypothetical protein
LLQTNANVPELRDCRSAKSVCPLLEEPEFGLYLFPDLSRVAGDREALPPARGAGRSPPGASVQPAPGPPEPGAAGEAATSPGGREGALGACQDSITSPGALSRRSVNTAANHWLPRRPPSQ